MTTDKQYNSLATNSYSVDAEKKNPPWRDGDVIYENENRTGQSYYVVKSQDNQSNGFQCMLVAPIVKSVKLRKILLV